MRTCPKCGTSNPPDRDFCACGEYLRWEPTGFMPSITPPQPPAEELAPDAADEAGAPAPPPPRAAPPPQAPPPPPPREHETYHPPRRPAASPPPPPPRPPEPAPQPPARQEPPAAARPEPAVQSAAAITLRLPRDERRVAPGELGVAVVPGERARVLALVRNQSEIVDNYDIVVHGIPREWWTATPPTVYLIPFGSGGGYEQEIEIVLHPPRSPEAHAGRHPLQIAVLSRAAEAEVATAAFTLGILPFEQYAISLKPQRASGRRRARYTVSVANSANAGIALALDAADDDGECDFAFDAVAVEAPAGGSATTRLQVRPPKQIWVGRPLERRFAISSASGEEGEQLLAARDEAKRSGRMGLPGKLPKIPGVTPPKVAAPKLSVGPDGVKMRGPQVRAPQVRAPRAKAINLVRPTMGLKALRAPDQAGAPAVPAPPLTPTQGVYRQKPWLPWWLSIVVPLLALLAMMLFLLLPRSVEVPDVVGSPDVAAAQAALVEAELVLGGKETRVSDEAKPGAVLAQAPAAGKSVKKGTAVSVVYAVGNGQTTVPKLAGLTLTQADAALRNVELQKGALSVQPPDLKAQIASTLPAAGESVKVGSAVDIFFVEPKPAGGKGGGKGGKGGVPVVDKNKDGKPDAPAGGADVAIPPVEPTDVQGYGQTLSKAGLVPGKPERRISDAKAGTVFATEPPVATKVAAGTEVKLLVSAGFPRFAFDDDQNILQASGATGKRIAPAIAKSGAKEKDAAWSPDGETVVYTAGGRLLLADMTQPGRDPQPLRPESERYADPSFAPLPARSVLAVARINGNDRQDTDLCVGTVSLDSYAPQCIPDDRFNVTAAHWSPGGRTILVGATAKDKRFGMVRYRSTVPFSPRKADWGKGEFVTARTERGGVVDMDFSPDGKQLAAIANLDTGDPRLYITTFDDLRLRKTKPTEIQACKVDWLDGRWLVLTKLGPGCDQPIGEIVRVAVDDLASPFQLAPEGDNPTFAPLSLGG